MVRSILLFYPCAFFHEPQFIGNLVYKMFSYPVGIPETGGIILFILGGYTFFKRDRTVFFIFFAPIVLVLIMSSRHCYPFEGRFILFYVPIIYIFAAQGLSWFMQGRRWFLRIGGIVMAFLIFFNLVKSYPDTLKRLRFHEEIEPVLAYVQRHIQKDDSIYVHFGAIPAFKFYARSYGLEKYHYIRAAGPWKDWAKFKSELNFLKDKKRVWIIFSYVRINGWYSEDSYITYYLSTIGKRLDMTVAPGASAYLYGF